MKSLWLKVKAWAGRVRWAREAVVLVFIGLSAVIARDVWDVLFLYAASVFVRFIIGEAGKTASTGR